jgi:hypothetical protein
MVAGVPVSSLQLHKGESGGRFSIPAVGSTIAFTRLNRSYAPRLEILVTLPKAGQEGREMDSDYMFLCGVMWCRFGQQEAGKELLRAATSMDPDLRALAQAMWAKGALRLRDLERGVQTSSNTIL